MELQHSQSKHLDGTFSGNAGDEGEIEVWGVNDCGESRYSQEMYVTQYTGGPCVTCLDPIPVVPYPNSSDQEFKLDFRTLALGSYYIIIYDENSNIKYQGGSGNYEKKVQTLDIPNGIYYLHL